MRTVLAEAGFLRARPASAAGALRLPSAAAATAPAFGSTVTPPSRSVCPPVDLRLRWVCLAPCHLEQHLSTLAGADGNKEMNREAGLVEGPQVQHATLICIAALLLQALSCQDVFDGSAIL